MPTSHQLSIVPENTTFFEQTSEIMGTLMRRVQANTQYGLDEKRRRLLAAAVDETVRDLQGLAATLLVPGRADPAQLAAADLRALHEVHGLLSDMVRNIHLYLDGRATR